MGSAPHETNWETRVNIVMTVLSAPLQTSVDTACPDRGAICTWVYDISGGSDRLAQFSEWFLDRPIRFLAVILGAWLLSKILRRSIRKVVTHIVTADRSSTLQRLDRLGVPISGLVEPEEDPIVVERRHARALSISNVLGSAVSVAVWSIGFTTALGTVGINLGPLIAGAGIAGVALGFGAQSLVQDCIAGLFMLLEDQYGIGDVIDLGEAVGVVEEVTLRTTVLRSLNGTVWHVPNGQVSRVGNLSQLWSVAVIDIDVAYDSDLAEVRSILNEAVSEVCAREEFTESVLEPPVVLGVESLGADGITLRVTIKVDPGDQWSIQRAVREHVKVVFDRHQIEIPFPQRTVWVRNEGEIT